MEREWNTDLALMEIKAAMRTIGRKTLMTRICLGVMIKKNGEHSALPFRESGGKNRKPHQPLDKDQEAYQKKSQIAGKRKTLAGEREILQY